MTISASARTRVVVLLTAVAVALVLLLAVTAAARAGGTPAPDEPAAFVTHTVRSGDTLWEIAGVHAPQGADLRDFVFDLKQVNGLASSGLQPGQILLIPVP